MTYPNDPGHAAGSATSEEAAEAAKAFAGPLRERVFVYIERRGIEGATDEDVYRALGLRVNSETARRRELELAGRVFDSGRTRKGSSMLDRVVWVADRAHVRPGYTAPLKGKQKAHRGLRSMLHIIFIAAASAQGGHSKLGGLIADLLDIPFPLTMANLEKAAIAEGFEPIELWPWLYKMRSDRLKQAEKDIVDLEELLDGR